MRPKQLAFFCSFFLFLSCQTPQPTAVDTLHESRSIPVVTATSVQLRPSTQATGSAVAISTQGIFSTQAAREILKDGGNLIDAAVAASFVISVERPQSTGIGGGGFLLFHEGKSQKTWAVDFRERAPLQATENMFLGRDGKPNPTLSRQGLQAVAVPGLVAGLFELHQRFGKLPFQRLLKPAILLAERGFPIYPRLAEALKVKAKVLKLDPNARSIFLDAKGNPRQEGTLLVQKDLAATLRRIAKFGRNGFYEGPIAQKLIGFLQRHRGLISEADLKSYEVKWREPVVGSFQGYQIFSMPPPSSGGIHVIQFLQFLENDLLHELNPLSARSLHLEASALQSAFADRAVYLGDPDFVHVPAKELISRTYLQRRRSEVNPDRARSAEHVHAGELLPAESTETTHLSLMDADNNAISTTQTINGFFGAGVVVPRTGIVLNNEMDDFSAQVGSSNLFGAIGSKANAIFPRKTPLSSMAPTILMRDQKVQLAIGAPGGTRIISCVAQTILNWIEFRMPLSQAISAVRYHHQWKPDVLEIEPPGPDNATLEKLSQMGYQVQIKPIPCEVMAVGREGDTLSAVADPRDIGTSTAY